jgi:hypothetical protein
MLSSLARRCRNPFTAPVSSSIPTDLARMYRTRKPDIAQMAERAMIRRLSAAIAAKSLPDHGGLCIRGPASCGKGSDNTSHPSEGATMRLKSLAAASAIAFAGGVLATVPAAAAETAKVSALHGVPGLTVDVYANDQELIPNFQPGTLAGPLDVPAGTYNLKVFPDGQGPNGTPAIEATGVQVPAGANARVAAHLDEAGKPKLTVFVNDTAPVPAGKARLTVRHVAAAPAVDVRAGGSPVIQGLTNPNEKSLEVDAGTVSADVVLAGTTTVALGPADLNLAEGTSTIVYAWGSAQQNNLGLATQSISGLHSAPSGVPGGEAGLVANCPS